MDLLPKNQALSKLNKSRNNQTVFYYKSSWLRLILVAILIFVISFTTWLFVGHSKPNIDLSLAQNLSKATILSSDLSGDQTHTKLFFEEKLFYQGVNQAKFELKSTVNIESKPIKGGIVPHHLFPSFILSDFFQRLQIQNQTNPIKQVVVIGPNHSENGNNWALSSLYSWSTPFGELRPNPSNIEILKSKQLIQIDEKVLSLEHSIGGLAPYLKYYLPQAQITPIILKHKINPIQLEKLSQTIADMSQDSDTIVIASVDFSHYLPADQAKVRDTKTLEILKNYDFNQLLKLNDDYLDSPATIATLLKTMQKLKTTDPTLLYHTNSGILENDFSGQTTSYISIVFK